MHLQFPFVPAESAPGHPIFRALLGPVSQDTSSGAKRQVG